ncbi:uncharacterized protein [Branchiostoma lanceolatum]|uniref:uncharacterized protein n=1 Tax=Branchiostoma lanceolatum TaxID=7740 RepID=UPI0034565A82
MGFGSLMSLYPDVSGGVFTAFNGPAVPDFVKDVNSIIHYRVADMLLGLDPWLNTTTACSFPQPWAKDPVTDVTMPPAPSRDFPRDKRDYEGTFGNSIFGNLTVYLNSTDDTLRFKVGLIGHGVILPLSPVNSVLLKGPASQFAPVVAYVEEMQGAINRLVIPETPPEPPVVFVRGMKLTDVEEPPTEGGVYARCCLWC